MDDNESCEGFSAKNWAIRCKSLASENAGLRKMLNSDQHPHWEPIARKLESENAKLKGLLCKQQILTVDAVDVGKTLESEIAELRKENDRMCSCEENDRMCSCGHEMNVHGGLYHTEGCRMDRCHCKAGRSISANSLISNMNAEIASMKDLLRKQELLTVDAIDYGKGRDGEIAALEDRWEKLKEWIETHGVYDNGRGSEEDEPHDFYHDERRIESGGSEKAKCNSCSHIQDAKLGFSCKKCGGETFTNREEKELTDACKSKFIPLESGGELPRKAVGYSDESQGKHLGGRTPKPEEKPKDKN